MTEHNHQHCQHQALQDAEAICQARGERLTPIRRRVLEIVWRSHKAIKAYDVLAELQKHDAGAKPPTAYRALDFLLTLGLIHRIESLNAFVGCPHPGGQHPFQMLVCNECGLVQELQLPELAAMLKKAATDLHFQAQQQIVEVRGRCHQCQANAADTSSSSR